MNLEINMWLIVTLVLIIVLLGMAFRYLVKSSDNFITHANKVEKMIVDNADFDDVFESLYELQKKAWHRNMGYRLSELIKMAEIKYNKQIRK